MAHRWTVIIVYRAEGEVNKRTVHRWAMLQSLCTSTLPFPPYSSKSIALLLRNKYRHFRLNIFHRYFSMFISLKNIYFCLKLGINPHFTSLKIADN